MNRILAALVILCLLFSSCKKDSFITSADANISLSADTLKYDTVFTTTGSITQSFKIYNTNNQKLLLSQVKLMGGNNSAYKININGIAASSLDNIEVAANDSIYVFVNVTINPNNNNLPFIVTDSIRISYNGNEKFVQLQAYGQNAHFLDNETIQGNVTWSNDLPYVILGGLQIDTTAVLNIDAGCKIYAHADAPILVDGTMIVTGEKNNEVVFTGDRLDADYKDLPASWPGIYFQSSSKNNVMSFSVVKNAYQAIVVNNPSNNINPKLTLHQCIIDNAFDAGILASNTSIVVENTLISNCGKNIQLVSGGNYEFTNCTVASYSNYYALHDKPVLQVANFNYENGSVISNDLTGYFKNCIFWGDYGSVDNEIQVSKEGNNLFTVNFEHCLYKSLTTPENATLTNNLSNQDPLFDSVDVEHNFYDFRMTKASNAPAVDNGTNTVFPKDLDDQPRQAGSQTDIGCYEKQ